VSASFFFVKIHPVYQILFILFIVLGVYYPILFAEETSIDDARMFNHLINQYDLDLKSLFFPSSGCYYYRPILYLTFLIDRFLFLCQSEIMHFENVLIHCLNAVLVFWLTRQIFIGLNNDKYQILPLITTILFSIHPLTSEPVNWISGRTDLLAGLFSLAAFNLFIYNSSKGRWWVEWIAAIFLLTGLLCKEVAAATGLAIFFALMWKDMPCFEPTWPGRFRRLYPYVLSGIMYLWMRTGFAVLNDTGFTSAVKGAHGAAQIPLLAKLGSLIKALGFYAMKIVWPFPLNFAIIEINRPLCFSVGILALIIILWWIWKRKGRISFFLFWAVLFISPALLVAVNRMAWTPLAERYLYIPLMGFSCAVGLLFYRYFNKPLLVCLMTVLFAFGWSTASRNIIWQQNLTLFADVVKKSPGFALGHNEYAIALLKNDQKEEAEYHFRLAAKLGKGAAHYLAEANLQGFEPESTDSDQLSNILSQNIPAKLQKELLHSHIKQLNKKLVESADSSDKEIIMRQCIRAQGSLYELEKNPHSLYRQGQLYLALGQKAMSARFFRRACKESKDYYTQAACRLHKQLITEIGQDE